MKHIVAFILILFALSFTSSGIKDAKSSNVKGLRIRIHTSAAAYQASYLFAGPKRQLKQVQSSADLDAQAQSDFVSAIVNCTGGKTVTVELYQMVHGIETLAVSGTGSIVILGTRYNKDMPNTFFVQTHP